MAWWLGEHQWAFLQPMDEHSLVIFWCLSSVRSSDFCAIAADLYWDPHYSPLYCCRSSFSKVSLLTSLHSISAASVRKCPLHVEPLSKILDVLLASFHLSCSFLPPVFLLSSAWCLIPQPIWPLRMFLVSTWSVTSEFKSMFQFIFSGFTYSWPSGVFRKAYLSKIGMPFSVSIILSLNAWKPHDTKLCPGPCSEIPRQRLNLQLLFFLVDI